MDSPPPPSGMYYSITCSNSFCLITVSWGLLCHYIARGGSTHRYPTLSQVPLVYVSVSCVLDRPRKGLLTLVTSSKTSVVVAEAVVVLRQLLQQNPDFDSAEDIVRRLALLLLQSFLDDEQKSRLVEQDQSGGTGNGGVASAARASLAQPGARASIIWTLGEYHQHISAVATDVLRVLAKAFPELEEEVKMQVGAPLLHCIFCHFYIP